MKSLAQCLAHIERSAIVSYCCCFAAVALMSAMAPVAEQGPSYGEGINAWKECSPYRRHYKHFTCIDSSNPHNCPLCTPIIPIAQRRKLRHREGK